MFYQSFLGAMHVKLAPAAYLEIGVRTGMSLALSRCRTVAIDPAFSISAELDGDYALFRTTSDEYFTRPDPLAPTLGVAFDMAFIDGLHLFEYALRDFINTERYCSARSVIVFDDVLPRNVAEASRHRRTSSWTGDVYPIIAVLARYRPELTVIPVNTRPTGLLLVMGLDASDTTLADHYHEIVQEYRHPDPQPVPPELMDRMWALPPDRVLDADFWAVLVRSTNATPTEVRHRLAVSLRTSLGDFARFPAGESADARVNAW